MTACTVCGCLLQAAESSDRWDTSGLLKLTFAAAAARGTGGALKHYIFKIERRQRLQP